MDVPVKHPRSHFAFIVFYITLFFIGLSIFTDYGISWDESVQRRDNGLVNYNYIHHDDYKSLIEGNEKYHGPAFEVLLIYAEKAFKLTHMRNIFLMRHLATFLVFYLSVLFFYLALLRTFKSGWLALLGSAMLVLSPRIFADAFYNSKDLVFMALFIINIYSTILFLDKKNIGTALFHGFVCAFVIDTRVLGIIIPAFTFLLIFIDVIRKKEIQKTIVTTGVFTIFLIAFTILCWPVLWKDPVMNFIKGIQEMSHYHWDSYMLYMGKRADASYIPWHYIPVWMAVTIPILYLLLFLSGLLDIIKRFITRKSIAISIWLNMYVFFLPLLAVIILHSVVYDGWRHMFFIYPSMLVIAISGLNSILISNQSNKIFIRALKSGTILYCLYIAFVMCRLHPYENIYFNKIAGSSIPEIRKNFEIDYWGLSYKEGIEYILRSDTSSHIIIAPAENPGRDNLKIFREEDRARIFITADVELADYFLTTYRYHHHPYLYKSDYEVRRNGGPICSVFDLRKKKLSLTGETNRVLQVKHTGDDPNKYWMGGNMVNDTSAYSGTKVEVLDENSEFGCSLLFNAPAELIVPNRRYYVDITFQMKSNAPFDARIVFQVDSGNSVMYAWEGIDIQSSLVNKWLKQDFRLLMPRIFSTNDKIKIYIWNYRHNNFRIDDLEISFYSIPEEEYILLKGSMPEEYKFKR